MQAGMKPASGILLFPCAKHKHALSDGWKRGQVNLKVDVFFSQICINSQGNLTAYKIKKMDIYSLVDDGTKNVIILQMVSFICFQREKENT